MIAVVIVVIAGASTALVIATRPRVVCTTAILSKAAYDLTPTHGAELQKLSDQIVGMRGYDKDANCLYVVLTNSIRHSDTKNADLYLSKLNKAYDPVKGFSPQLKGADFNTIDNFNTVVSFMHKQDQQVKSNFNTFGNPR